MSFVEYKVDPPLKFSTLPETYQKSHSLIPSIVNASCISKNIDEKPQVLLIKSQNDLGQLHAISTKCTHYGAPLDSAVISSDGRIVCPWHGACFSIETGDIEDAPALDALQSFKVVIRDDYVYVLLPADISNISRRQPSMCKVKHSDQPGVVVIGGGVASQALVEGLRQKGYTGKIDVFSAENYYPIDRTKLSKALMTDPSKIALRPPQFYKDNDITYHLNSTCSNLDTSKKIITLSNGATHSYSTLVLAVGGIPNELPLPGFDMETVTGIFKIRSVDDVKALMSVVKDNSKIAVIGSSFIGIEVANALKDKEREVTVIDRSKCPMEKVLGKDVGSVVQKLLEDKGVKFCLNSELDCAVTQASNEGKETVTAIKLKSGKQIEADVVVLGVGVKPNTAFLTANSGINLSEDGGIIVDEYMNVKGHSDVYAIGDIARFPYGGKGGHNIRVEHYNVALNQGHTAALSITNNRKPFTNVPIFWSACGMQLRYCGHTPEGFDECFLQGKPEESKFIAYYIKNEKVVAVASMQMDPAVSKSAELLRVGGMPSVNDIKAGLDVRNVEIKAGPKQGASS